MLFADPSNLRAARPRLCYVVSTGMTVSAFLRNHIQAAAQQYDVFVVANEDDPECLSRQGLPATLLSVPIYRKVSPVADLRALWCLCMCFRRWRFDIVHSVSPKAGLLAMFAAWLVGTPVRLHVFTGQVWATRKGWKRAALKSADRLLAALASHVLVDSPSQRDFLIAEGILPGAKAKVIGRGSICGVDGNRFKPDAVARARVRGEFGIANDDLVVAFIGRIGREKGVLDLAAAFGEISLRFPGAWLLLVGPDEGGLLEHVRALAAGGRDRVCHVGYTVVPERYLAAADIFCLPSHREGFGMVAIEAAATGLPVIASRIYGITDAVEDGVTGLLHPARDVAALGRHLACLGEDAALRRKMGEKGRERACRDFSQGAITRGMLAYYEKIRRSCR